MKSRFAAIAPTRVSRGCERVYFGAEFCQHLLPSAAEVAEILDGLRRQGVRPTLVTPPVDDRGLRLLDPLVALLDGVRDVEIVVNDWGVGRWLRRTGARIEVVLGRLMHKMLRDPRLTPRLDMPGAPDVPLAVLRSCGVTSPPFLETLSALGIQRVELDLLYQGVGIDFAASGLRPTLHLPFGVVTTGRICHFAGLGLPRRQKFQVLDGCGRGCLEFAATMASPGSLPRARALLAHGNSIFYGHDRALVRRGLSWARKHAARVVIHETPMSPLALATDDIDAGLSLLREWFPSLVETPARGSAQAVQP